MFPRADINGARPIAAIDAAKPTASIADPRQDVTQRLAQIAVGRMMQAQVLSRLDDGSFMVKLASPTKLADSAKLTDTPDNMDTPVRMNLPAGTQVGDDIELTLVATQPRPTFSLATPGRETGASLSNAGRLIDSILRSAQKEGAPAALVGKTPLLPSPAATPQQMAKALKDTVASSGLFYESHLAQWASGKRPLNELLREPQAKYSNPQLLAAALQPKIAGQAAAAMLVPAEHLLPLPQSEAAPSTAAEAPNNAPSTLSAANAASQNDVPDTASDTPLPAPTLTGAPGTEQDASTPADLPTAQSQITDAAAKTTTGAAPDATQVHATMPGSEAAQIINLQLDALEQRRVAWQGELWPGQPMEWEVSEDSPHGTTSEGERTWQSVVRFSLPVLGTVSATINLAGNRLQMQVRATSDDTALLLRQHGPELASALDAAGSPLDLLTVRRDETA